MNTPPAPPATPLPPLLMSGLEVIPIPLLVLDDGLNAVFANEAGFHLLRIRHLPHRLADSLRDLRAFLDTVPELMQPLAAASFQLSASAVPVAQSWQHGDRIFSLSVFAIPAPGAPPWIGVCFTDETEALRDRNQYEATRRYIEAVLDSLPVGVTVMDTELSITSVNRTQRQFMHHVQGSDSLLQFIGFPAGQIFAADDGISWDDLAQRLQRGETFSVVGTASYPGESGQRLFAIAITALRDEGGEARGVIRVCEDVTDKLRMQQELKEAELIEARLETLRHITGAVQHSINNSLTAILGNVGIILTSPPGTPGDDPLTLSMLRSIEEQAVEIQSFTRDLGAVTVLETTPYLDHAEERLLIVGDRFKD